MFVKFYWMLFSSSMTLGTLFAVSSSSWLASWVGLEINLMSFIPLLLIKLSPSHSEAAIKYFLIQTLASLAIVFPGVLFNSISLTNEFMMSNELITLSLATKAGMAPVHFWFPQVMELTEWTQAIVLLTWQKIAPLALMSFSLSLNLLMVITASAIVGMAGGFNQNSIKKIMTYSSIAHMAWMSSIAQANEKSWWLYLIIYFILSLAIMIPMSTFNLHTMNKMNHIPSKSLTKPLLLLSILSMAGLPPFLGVLPKIMVILNLYSINFNFFGVTIILITTSLMTLFYYMRMFFSSLIMFTPMNMTTPPKPSTIKLCNSLFSLSLLGNILIFPLVLLF